MSAPELREAASVMRERADNATGSPWQHIPIEDEAGSADSYVIALTGHTSVGEDVGEAMVAEDAEHIASWHPDVAFLVATWLDSEADRLADLTHAIPNVVVSDGVLREWGFGHALDVARAYLGGAA